MNIQDAVDKFLAESELAQSERTVKTYGTALRRFLEYLAQAGKEPKLTPTEEIEAADAIDFVAWLVGEHFRGTDVPKSTLRTYLAAISRFYQFLVRESLASFPANEYERMKAAYHDFRRGSFWRLPHPASEEAVEEMIKAARSIPPCPEDRRCELRRLRDVAMLETLRSTGMRVGELVGLRRGDLDYRQHTARVIGKGNKERIVYFDSRAWNAVKSYLNARQDGASGKALYQLPVFARHDKGAGKKVLPLSTNSVRSAFNKIRKLAGVEEPMTPHSLRHSFATKALEVTGDLAVVQDMLGHASPTTTRIYAKVSTKRLKEAHEKIFGYREEDE